MDLFNYSPAHCKLSLRGFLLFYFCAHCKLSLRGFLLSYFYAHCKLSFILRSERRGRRKKRKKKKKEVMNRRVIEKIFLGALETREEWARD